ncbi:MAG: hypothetical protein L0Y66_05135 [Myxococcaceae bacterium]|nr:hypothetical protein [Myxococcaceae bacterium]
MPTTTALGARDDGSYHPATMTRSPTAAWTAEVLPRYVYLESLIAGRNVLELGAAAETAGRSARFLRDKEAARVVSLDSDAARVARLQAGAGAGLEFRSSDLRTLEPGSFDLIIHHQGTALVEDPTTLSALKGLLTREGHLVLVVREARGLALADLRAEATPSAEQAEELLRALQNVFRSVEVATQSVFFGYTLSSAPEGAPETALDESLTDEATPAYRMFLCGLHPSGLNTVSLVPLASASFRELVEARPERLAPNTDPLGLDAELDADERAARMRELEARTQAAVDEAERTARAAAHALAERDHALTRFRALEGTQAPAPQEDATTARELERVNEVAEELRMELVARIKADAERTSQLEALQSTVEELAARDAQLREQVRTLTERLAASEGTLMARLAVSEDELSRSMQAQAEAERRRDAAEADRARTQATLEALEHTAEELQRSFGGAQAQLTEKSAVLEAHAQELAARVEEQERLRVELEAQQASELARMRAETAELERERKQLGDQVLLFGARAQELEQAFEDTERARRRTEDEGTRLQAHRDALILEVAQLEPTLVREREALASAQARESELERALAEARQERDEAVRARDALERERDEAIRLRQVSETERDEAMRLRQTAELERDEALKAQRDALDRLEAEAQRTARELEERQATMTRLGDSLRDVAQRASEVRAAREEAERLAHEHQARQREVERELVARGDAAALAAERMKALLATDVPTEGASPGDAEKLRSEAERLVKTLGEHREGASREAEARDVAERAAATAAERLRVLVSQLPTDESA